MDANKKYDGLEIAVIGISGRFPQSDNYREYWKNLRDGKELLKTYTDDELRKAGVSEDAIRDLNYVRTVGTAGNKDHFDSAFFKYSAEEAALMDPQTRVFHEHCWEALEDAGYAASIDKLKIGLYAGASSNDNWKMYAYGRSEHSAIEPFYLHMIMDQKFISTLLAYKLNLRGPAVFVDTACSTSLVAVHLACRSLLTRDCSLALAGGVSLKTLKGKGYYYKEHMVSSQDGHCRAFDEHASGTASGEGAGVVVLKRLGDAIKDRDHIYAIIKATAVNNDGNLKVGYTAPSVKGQVDCIRTAQQLAGIDPHSISYIEAHGTATKLGDPIEIRALNEAFGLDGKRKFCAIGSVKSNMGHLDAAAGIAGFIKTVLSLKHREIPASLNYVTPNPAIDFDGGPFYVNTALKPWRPEEGFPLRAGVSSLGIGGTNAHIILEEAPDGEAGLPGRAYKLLLVSASTREAVGRYFVKLKEFLTDEPGVDLADMSYTLTAGRKSFAYRKAFVYRDRDELTRLLDAGSMDDLVRKSKGEDNPVVLMFSGAGSQYVNMGKGIYEIERVFREEMDKGFGLLKALTGVDYKEIFYPSRPDDQRINRMLYAQPAIFVFEYALARLVMSYGINPAYMIGHSVGEYAAACISGVFTYEDAMRLVVKRGELMNSLPAGAMLSAQLTEQEATSYLNASISLAAVNGPGQVVFSGNAGAVDALAEQLEQKGISWVRLHANQAGHSYMLDEILAPYEEFLRTIPMKEPQIPFVSCLTGQLIKKEECTSPGYWRQHMRETVRFSDGIAVLDALDRTPVFIEIGGSNSLTTLLKQRYADRGGLNGTNLVRHPKEEEDDQRYLADRLTRLWLMGVNPDWELYFKDERRRKISVPTYAFEPSIYPAEVSPFAADASVGSGLAATKQIQGLKDWIYYPSWRRTHIASGVDGAGKSYLFFCQDEPLSSSIAARLRSTGELVEVFAGRTFEKISSRQYSIDPTSAEHFEQLFWELKSDRIVLTDILYSWTMAAGENNLELARDNQEINLAYFSLVWMIRGLLRMGEQKGKRVTIVTDALQHVLGIERMSYAQSLALSLTTVISQELSVPCRNIDVDSREGLDICAETLVRELGRQGTMSSIAALRLGQRWLPDYRQRTLPLSVEKPIIRQGGVYLITGGLGNVGFTLAKHLIERYGAKVALAGRRDGNGPERKRLSELKAASPHVQYYALDVSDASAFEQMVAAVDQSLGPVQGVIHAAGVTENNHFELIENMTVEKALTMFGPKLKGLENIYRVFKDRAHDFVWVTSSMSSILGGLGYAAYAAANSYMNYFIASVSKELPQWKCMVLGGLAFDAEAVKKEAETYRSALVAQEIIELFEWSLAEKDNPVILQAIGDLTVNEVEHAEEGKTTVVEELLASGAEAKRERPELFTAWVQPETPTELRLTSIYEEFFGIKGIGADDSFFDLGGDSLKAMMLLKRLNIEFQINLSVRDFIVNSSVRLIAGRIDEGLWLKSGAPMENEMSI